MASGLKGKLTVTIHKAIDLKDVQTFGKQDPYCKLSIGNEQFNTRIVKGGGKNPSWEQAFLFNLTGVEDALHIKINDQETTIDRPIGRCDIQLQDLVTKASKGPATFQVLDVSNFSKMAGQIQISVEFTGTGLVSSNTSTSTNTAASTPTPAPAPVQPVQQKQPVQQQPPQQQYQQPPQQYQQHPQQYQQQQPPMYQQAPVYAQAPAPVYVQQPAPVVYQQPIQPVYVQQPQVVYGQPMVQPMVQPGIVYGQPIQPMVQPAQQQVYTPINPQQPYYR